LPGPIPDFLRQLAPKAGRARAGVRVTDLRSGARLVWAPRIARYDSAVLAELRAADLRLVDGTCLAAEEGRAIHPGVQSAEDLGHIPIDGRDGSLVWLAGMTGRSVYVHLAGSNPLCDNESMERARIHEAGIEVGRDGMEFEV
jgi:pyrroloquinoline quinone biosynthesis protein B